MYKRKKQKAKFKLRMELVAILVIVVAMITTSVVLRLPNAATKLANSYTEVGSTLGSDHLYLEVSFDELYEEMNKEGYTFVYFGSPECATCVTEVTTINSRAAYWDVEQVLYVDATDYMIDEEAEDYEEDKELTQEIKNIESKLNGNVSNGISDISLEYIPAIWVFNDGELVFNSSDYLNEEEDGMILNWSAIADRAFCVNLPNYDELDK